MRKSMILLAMVLTVFAVGRCSSPQEKAPVLLFEYHDFGPQVIAHELIGFEWYQWHDHGFEEPGYCYNIKIVVYHEGDLERVKAKYPTVEGKVDYRYVDCKAAIEFLKSKISECDEAARDQEDSMFREIAQDLGSTLTRIERFGRANHEHE